jgi:ribose 5-phosphate isomerase A
MGSIANNKNDGPNIAVTDNGNYIVDLFFTAPIADVALAAKEIKATVGECARHLDCLYAARVRLYDYILDCT